MKTTLLVAALAAALACDAKTAAPPATATTSAAAADAKATATATAKTADASEAEGELKPGSEAQRAALQKAKLAFMANDDEAAERGFLEVLGIGTFSGAHVSAMIALGQIYIDRGERDKAMALYGKLLSAAPKLAEVQMVVGRAYAAGGERALAIRAMERALEIQPDYVFLYAELGALYAKMGNAERSAKMYLRYETKIYAFAKQLEDAQATPVAQRAHALDVLSFVRDDRANQAIVRALGDPDPGLREAAVLHAGQLKIAAAKPQLLAMEQGDADRRVRLAAKSALSLLVDVEVEPGDAPGPTRVDDKSALPK